ncbi:Uncharacterised protein [Mycobacteroides abscessus]|nr:Uncharacterised protein [Mycobacteroides abscessus]
MATWGISGPVDLLRRTGFLWWRCWPRLVGIWLAGWLVRHWLIKLAVYVGVHFGGFWGDLVMPLAVVARLATYILMYLVLRSESDLTGEASGPWYRGFVGILLKAILPVFVLFAAWRLILADYSSYVGLLNVDLYYAMDAGLSPDRTLEQTKEYMTPGDWRAYLAILLAFLARGALTKYSEKLPSWTQLVAVYLQALWVVLLLNAASNRLVGSPRWISERKIIVWYTERKQHVLTYLSSFGEVWKWISDAVGPMVLAVLLAVTWIAIVGAVYSVRPDTTWAGVSRAAFGEQQGARVTDVASRTGIAARASLAAAAAPRPDTRERDLPEFVGCRRSTGRHTPAHAALRADNVLLLCFCLYGDGGAGSQRRLFQRVRDRRVHVARDSDIARTARMDVVGVLSGIHQDSHCRAGRPTSHVPCGGDVLALCGTGFGTSRYAGGVNRT